MPFTESNCTRNDSTATQIIPQKKTSNPDSTDHKNSLCDAFSFFLIRCFKTFMSPHYWSHSEFMTHFSVPWAKSEVLILRHKSNLSSPTPSGLGLDWLHQTAPTNESEPVHITLENLKKCYFILFIEESIIGRIAKKYVNDVPFKVESGQNPLHQLMTPLITCRTEQNESAPVCGSVFSV